jgi:hypothetical protein
MKRIKIILGSVALLAIVVVAAFNMSVSKQSQGLPAIMLANIEALAQESGGNTTQCGTATRYEYRSELCGNGSQTTSLHIQCYSRTTGPTTSYQSGCRTTGFDCYGYVNTDNVETRNCGY